MTALAVSITAVLGSIALLHGYWAAGGLWPGDSPTRLGEIVVGRPGAKHMPSPGLCAAVAAILTGAAAWPLLLSPVATSVFGPQLAAAGTLGLAAIFLLRGLAGYSPAMTRRHSAQPFARYNRLYYSPLCLALGAGFLILALNGETT